MIDGLPTRIDIGYEGEQNSRPIPLDCSILMERFPNTVPTLLIVRPKATEYVPVATGVDGVILWTPSAVDCQQTGYGMAQIRCISETGDVVGMSHVITLYVNKSIPGVTSEEMPDPVKPWVDPLLAAAATVSENASKAKTYASNAESAADHAEKSAEDAEKSAGEAKASADAAKESADTAVAVAEGAAAVAQHIDRSATFVAQKTEEAENSATNAARSATSARLKAEESERYAQRAETAVQTTDTNAKSADTSASIAAQKAKDAAESAHESLTSAVAAQNALKKMQEDVASGALRGKDGFSPIANAERVEDGVKITIKDANGTSTAVVKDGKGEGGGGGDIEQDPEDPSGGIVVPGTLAEIDKSLTLDNYAADAKVVGDQLSALREDNAKHAELLKTVTGTTVSKTWENSDRGLVTDYAMVAGRTYTITSLVNFDVSLYVDTDATGAIALGGGKKMQYTPPKNGKLKVYTGAAAAGLTFSCYIAGMESDMDELKASVAEVVKTTARFAGDIDIVYETTSHSYRTNFPVEAGKTYLIKNTSVADIGFNAYSSANASVAVVVQRGQSKYLKVQNSGYLTVYNGASVIGTKMSLHITDQIERMYEELSEDGAKYYVGFGQNDGVRYFTKLTDCLWAVTGNTDKKTIYVNAGTYDILTELGGVDYVESYNRSDTNWIEVNPYIENARLIGVGNVKLTFNLPSTVSYDHGYLFSPLNIHGEVYVENIAIEASNCRYCIHDESSGANPNTHRRYKNVRLSMGGSGGSAYGCGYSAGTTVEIEDSTIACRWNSAWYSHAVAGAVFIFKNSIFKTDSSSSPAVSFAQTSGSDQTIRLENCFFKGHVSIGDTAGNTQQMRSKVDVINSNVDVQTNMTTRKEAFTRYMTADGTETVILAANA